MVDLSDILIVLLVGALGILTIVCVGIAGYSVYADTIVSEGTITVVEKIGAHGDEGQYLIIAEDDQVYTVEDNFIKGKWDASDRYAALKVGKTYHVTFTGFRNHFLSWYKNIIEFEEVTA